MTYCLFNNPPLHVEKKEKRRIETITDKIKREKQGNQGRKWMNKNPKLQKNGAP